MTAVSHSTEREVKLSIDLGADLPDLRRVVGASVRQPDEDLHAVYYDTPDLRLWERGITLRHRTGEAEPRWTLKVPLLSTGHTLVRSELEWEGGEDQVPGEALEVVRGIVRRAPLQKVTELETERVRFLLEDGGVVWGELTSDKVTVVGGQRDGMRFRQLEVETRSDTSAGERETAAVVKALRRVGARPDPRPKIEAALGKWHSGPKLGSKSSTQDVVRFAISSGLARLVDHDCRIRIAGQTMEPEDVHQARVATRRLRSDLRTLEPLIDPIWVHHVREDLRWIGATLGAVRDVDVLTEGLRQAGAGDRLIGRLHDERRSAIGPLLDMLKSERYLDTLDRLHAASGAPPLPDQRLAGRRAQGVVPGLVNRRWKALRKTARTGGQRPTADRLHQIRKKSKQLRYASELARPVIGKAADRTAKAAESLQTLLGEYHDSVVAGQWLKRTGDLAQSDTAREIASLVLFEERRKNRLARGWRSGYKRLAKKKHRVWMGSHS